jgi:hypothetical protein
MNTRRKLVGLAFSVLLLAIVLIPTHRAEALTMGDRFETAAHWRLQSLSYVDADIGVTLDESMVMSVGGQDRAEGLRVINNYIQSQGIGVFFDSNTTDDNQRFVKADCGQSVMRWTNDGVFALVDLYLNFPNIGCTNILADDSDFIRITASLSNGALNTLFAFTSADTIVRVDGIGGNFTLSDPVNFPSTYFSSSEGYLEVFSGGTVGQYYRNSSPVGQYNIIPFSGTPYVPPGGGPIGGPGAGGGNNGPIPPSCSNSSDGGPLKWIFCPILGFFDNMIEQLEDGIQDLLYVNDPIAGEGSNISESASEGLRSTWARFRNIALIILIPVMLIMIIGTAVGVSAFDAYTIRRAMPRFLVAIIFISISWYITSFLINLTNAVGGGIQGLMLSPFTLADGRPLSDSRTLSDLLSAGNAAIATTGSVGIFLSLAATGAITIPVLFSFGIAAAVSLFIGWFILTIRQMLIYALILLAPLAILSWIFPNNDKLWKIWWTTFSTLLIMFPTLMIVIAASKIFAYVIATL